MQMYLFKPMHYSVKSLLEVSIFMLDIYWATLDTSGPSSAVYVCQQQCSFICYCVPLQSCQLSVSLLFTLSKTQIRLLVTLQNPPAVACFMKQQFLLTAHLCPRHLGASGLRCFVPTMTLWPHCPALQLTWLGCGPSCPGCRVVLHEREGTWPGLWGVTRIKKQSRKRESGVQYLL